MIPYMSPVFYKDRVLRTNSLMFELTNFSKLHYFRLFHSFQSFNFLMLLTFIIRQMSSKMAFIF